MAKTKPLMTRLLEFLRDQPQRWGIVQEALGATDARMVATTTAAVNEGWLTVTEPDKGDFLLTNVRDRPRCSTPACPSVWRSDRQADAGPICEACGHRWHNYITYRNNDGTLVAYFYDEQHLIDYKGRFGHYPNNSVVTDAFRLEWAAGERPKHSHFEAAEMRKEAERGKA